MSFNAEIVGGDKTRNFQTENKPFGVKSHIFFMKTASIQYIS